MPTASFYFTNCGGQKETIAKKFPFTEISKGNVVMESALSPEYSLNDHLVWLWGKVKNERRFIKNLQDNGVTIVCRCRANKDEVKILPNGAEMLHLLGATLEVDIR